MFKKKDVIQKMGDTGPLLVCLTFKSISSHAHTTNQLLCDHPFVNIGYMKKKKDANLQIIWKKQLRATPADILVDIFS